MQERRGDKSDVEIGYGTSAAAGWWEGGVAMQGDCKGAR